LIRTRDERTPLVRTRVARTPLIRKRENVIG
jgi:hypothetical protein